jgi:hypothetical protein
MLLVIWQPIHCSIAPWSRPFSHSQCAVVYPIFVIKSLSPPLGVPRLRSGKADNQVLRALSPEHTGKVSCRKDKTGLAAVSWWLGPNAGLRYLRDADWPE